MLKGEENGDRSVGLLGISVKQTYIFGFCAFFIEKTRVRLINLPIGAAN